MLVLDTVNFGSGWFPMLRKRPGMSGYFTVAASLADHWRAGRAWSAAELRALTGSDVAWVLGQEADHELMELYAEALRDLGRFLGARRALDVVAEDGVLRYDPSLAARIDAGELLPPGEQEREIRVCAVHACELLAERLGMPARLLDTALWNRGQAARYKSVPRHRTRTVYY